MSSAHSTTANPMPPWGDPEPRLPLEQVAVTAARVWQPLAVLTDEELAALGPDPRGVVHQPYLSTLSPERADQAVTTAARSLRARGLTPGRDGHRAAATVTALRQVRDNAESVTGIRRTGADHETVPAVSRYLHDSGFGVLLEDVDDDGVHGFAFVEPDDLPVVLQAFLVPPGSVDGAAGFEVDPTQPAATGQLPTLAAATVTADVLVRRVGDGHGPGSSGPDLHGLFLGPSGCYRIRSRPGDPGPLRVHPIRAASVGAWVAALPHAPTPTGSAEPPGVPTAAPGMRD